jgi:predicted nucleotidyltransferase
MNPLPPDLEKVRRFLATHAAPNPLVAAITGSHFYGFPSADSDLDLKGIHVAPTAAVVSLHPPKEAVDFLDDFEGTEIDYTSHELGQALRLLLKGNGNILERLVSPFQVIASPDQERLAELGRGAISKKFHHHYRGFFATIRAQHVKAESKTAKGLLYCYRSALTGIHLLKTGECEGDVMRLAEVHGFARVPELVEAKRRGTEFGGMPDHERFEEDLPRLEAALAEAASGSTLPESPANEADVSAFLVEARRRFFV